MMEEAARLGCPSYVWQAGQERRLALVRRHIPLQGRRILDVGCGVGMYVRAFRRYSAHVYGIEVDADRASQAASWATGVVQGVGESLPFPDGVFDLVFSHEVLEHVADDRQTVCEMVRVTRPGGHLVVFVPNRLWPWETHGVYWRGQYHFGNVPLINYLPDLLRNRLAWHVRVYTRRELLRLFTGLPVTICHHTTVYPGFDKIIRRFPHLGPPVRAFAHRLEGVPFLRRFGLSHFLIAQRWNRKLLTGSSPG